MGDSRKPLASHIPPPPTIEERVQVCMRLMRRMKWRRGVTDKNLAAHWGLSPTCIRDYAAEASRRVKAEMTDPDMTAATVCVALDRVIREAAQKGMYGHKSIIEAAKTWAAIAGAGAPTRIEVGALATMTEEQLDRRRQELLKRLSADDHLGDNPPTAEETAARVTYEAKVEADALTIARSPAVVGGANPDAAALRLDQGCEEDDKQWAKDRKRARRAMNW